MHRIKGSYQLLAVKAAFTSRAISLQYSFLGTGTTKKTRQDSIQDFLDSSGNDVLSRRKSQPIFVLPEERGKRHALDNQTRASLIKMAEDLLDNMSLGLVLSYKESR